MLVHMLLGATLFSAGRSGKTCVGQTSKRQTDVFRLACGRSILNPLRCAMVVRRPKEAAVKKLQYAPSKNKQHEIGGTSTVSNAARFSEDFQTEAMQPTLPNVIV